MNYIYLKKFQQPLNIGDLTCHGIVTKVSPDSEFEDLEINNKPYVVSVVYPYKIVPFLIIDAPDEPAFVSMNHLSRADWTINMAPYIKKGIPFKSNQEVYSWLIHTDKTIEPDGLYKFDGDYEKELFYDMGHAQPYKISINQFNVINEDNIWEEILSYIILTDPNEVYISTLKEKYKIERR